MKKKITILVPTDFSAASRAGMRFAIQWAKQQDAKLVFAHMLRGLRMTNWSDRQYEAFLRAERILYSRRLRKIADEVCRPKHLSARNYSTEVVEGAAVEIALTEPGRIREGIDLICMATRGAGKLKKLFGTHTGNVIQHSDIPVVAVPAGYRVKPIKRILYATDLTDYGSELARIIKLTRALKAELIVMHFPQPAEVRLDPALVNKVWQKEFGYPVRLQYKIADPALSLADNLQKAIAKLKPSMVGMFTDRKRTLFQRVFYPSQTESLSFDLKVPLLVMGKRE